MWFKNLLLYRFSEPFRHAPEALSGLLADRSFKPVGGHELSSSGWTPPLGGDEAPLVHAANGYMMVCARKEERVLPSASVRETLEARIAEIEEKTSRRIRGKARTELKDEVIRDMLPRAFTRSRHTYAYIDPDGVWLVVDAGSPARGEEITRLLRDAVGSLPVRPLGVQEPPDAVMTHWLKSGQLPDGLAIGDECELREPGSDGGIVRVRKHDLECDEIANHLEAGKRVTRLALTYEDRISFVLDDKLVLKRLRFLDLIQDEAAAIQADSEAERFDGDFSIMSLELSRLLPNLVEAFGGEDSSTAH